MSLAVVMMSHSPASGVSGATLTLHGLKKEAGPAIHHPHLCVGTDTELPRLDPECPPQPGDEVRQSRRAWAAASATEAGSGGARLWYPCRGGKGAVVALEAILQQLSEGRWSYGQNTSGC